MTRPIIRALLGATFLTLVTAAPAWADMPAADKQMNAAMPKADGDMQAVLDKLASLGGKPIETLEPAEARKQPSPADAVMAIMKDKDIAADDGTVTTSDKSYTGADGSSQDARIYKPAGATGPLPVIVYVHGGGWVIADLDTYDATPRALAKMVQAVVVSVEYRHAPEAKFPAAHDDVRAAYKWVLENAGDWGGDTKRTALVGESAGGNMVIDTAIGARDGAQTMPVAIVAIYPVAATTKKDTESKKMFVTAKPLNTPMLDWFFKYTLSSPDQAADTRLDLVNAKLAKLPPTTIVLAEIDPLHDDGKLLGEKLHAAGVQGDVKEYKGVTHEFFGMGAVVAKAMQAETDVATVLKTAFAAPAKGQ